MVTPRGQQTASGGALNAHSHGKVFLVTFLLTVLLTQTTASIVNLGALLNVLLIGSIITVWLDGLTTDIGLKRGLKEMNSVLKALQTHAGNYRGLILSRMLPTALILYIAFILQTPYLLIPMTAIFLICNISNLLAIKNSHHPEQQYHSTEQYIHFQTHYLIFIIKSRISLWVTKLAVSSRIKCSH